MTFSKMKVLFIYSLNFSKDLSVLLKHHLQKYLFSSLACLLTHREYKLNLCKTDIQICVAIFYTGIKGEVSSIFIYYITKKIYPLILYIFCEVHSFFFSISLYLHKYCFSSILILLTPQALLINIQ